MITTEEITTVITTVFRDYGSGVRGPVYFHTYICDRDNHHRVLLFWKSHPGEDRGQCFLQITVISSVDSGNTQGKGNCRHRNMVSFQSTEKNII